MHGVERDTGCWSWYRAVQTATLKAQPLAQIPHNTQNSFERVIVRIVRILRLGTRIFDQQLLVISDLL
jgi:hypothetical protein